MRRHATKIVENKAKEYHIPAREEDPYYLKAPVGGYNNNDVQKRTAARPDLSSSSTSKHHARRADKIVAEEEAHGKAVSKLNAPGAGAKAGSAATTSTSGTKTKVISRPVTSTKGGKKEVMTCIIRIYDTSSYAHRRRNLRRRLGVSSRTRNRMENLLNR